MRRNHPTMQHQTIWSVIVSLLLCVVVSTATITIGHTTTPTEPSGFFITDAQMAVIVMLLVICLKSLNCVARCPKDDDSAPAGYRPINGVRLEPSQMGVHPVAISGDVRYHCRDRPGQPENQYYKCNGCAALHQGVALPTILRKVDTRNTFYKQEHHVCGAQAPPQAPAGGYCMSRAHMFVVSICLLTLLCVVAFSVIVRVTYRLD